MTTPEQIIAKIEEIEKMLRSLNDPFKNSIYLLLMKLLKFKQSIIEHFNLPTADPPEDSAGQSDMKG